MPDNSNWVVKGTKADCGAIAKALNVSEITARVIVNRGIKTYEEAASFLNPDISGLPDSFAITDMDKAVAVAARHIEKGSKIAVYADYDVDGVMSATILIKCLNYGNSLFYIPDRVTEGYGLNLTAVEELHNAGVSLIIACDNGIAAVNEAARIYEMGMELIIIDHHEPIRDSNENDILPKSEAIVNPKRSDCGYPFKSMCAAGLCFRFSAAYTGKYDDELLVLAAIATVCDIVDLNGDNRVIVKNGLELITKSDNTGLKQLIEMYELKAISTYHIGFIIGPTINASGRISKATEAVELFLTKDVNKAAQIAAKLYQLNQQRKALTEFAVKKLESMITTSGDKVFVMYDENIHESIAGIAAGRIKEKYNHPTVVITKGDESAKGSARSIDGYNIFNAVTEASHLLTKYGGHTGAAGFSIPYGNIDDFRRLLNENCDISDFTPKLYIDARLPLNAINFELAEEIAGLEPFGKANKEPVFAEKNVRVSKIEFLGKDKTVIKLGLFDAPGITAIAFGLYDKFMKILNDNNITNTLYPACFTLDIAFTVTINEYKGTRSIRLILKDIRDCH